MGHANKLKIWKILLLRITTLLDGGKRSLAHWLLATFLLCLACSSRRIAREVGGHCQLNVKNYTFVQQTKNYREFWAFMSPSIFTIPSPSAFLKGKASEGDFH